MLLINDKLRKLRLENDFTQEKVAGMIHISVPAYSKMETGKTDLNFSRLKQLAEVYKITLVQLFSGPIVSPEILELMRAKLLQKELEINLLRARLIELHQTLKLV